MLFSSAKYELLLEAIERRFFFRWRIISNKALICLACHEVVFYGMIECRRQREVNRDDERYFCIHIWFIASVLRPMAYIERNGHRWHDRLQSTHHFWGSEETPPVDGRLVAVLTMHSTVH